MVSSSRSRFFLLILHLVGSHVPLHVEDMLMLSGEFKENQEVWLLRQDECLQADMNLGDCGPTSLWRLKQPKQRRRRRNSSGQRYHLELVEPTEWNIPESDENEPAPRSCIARKRRRSQLLHIEDCRSSSPLELEFRSGMLATSTGECLLERDGHIEVGNCAEHHRVVRFHLQQVGLEPIQKQSRTTMDSRQSSSLSQSVSEESINAEDRTAQVMSSGRPSIHALSRDLAHEAAATTTSHKTGRDIPTSKQRVRLAKDNKNRRNGKPKNPLFENLRNTNPILFATGSYELANEGEHSPEDLTVHSSSTKEMKRNRMLTHPYLASSNDGWWTDPATNLRYPTDLCHYLGHTRQEAGRHTLVGVGQYTRTVLKVKIYGVALYVSKRDVLSDPGMTPFAGLSAEELRQKPDFYSHLRHMPSPFDPKAGLYDRTIFLQLNMQLSTETMRSSLKADWRLLTDERKDMLINSSMEPRPAEQPMLDTIMSPANPGRCSCGQVAPPEYKADRTCCARGTSLVFTWRKNGDIEIRVDGRVMDIFPRPDIAQGIFFEYLRYDDPISPDFQDRVVDGWPFLLAPLAQLQGVQMPSKSSSAFQSKASKLSRMGEWAGWMQNGASHVVSQASKTAKGLKSDLEKRRKEVFTSVSKRREDALKSSMGSWIRRFQSKSSSAVSVEKKSNKSAKRPIKLPRLEMDTDESFQTSRTSGSREKDHAPNSWRRETIPPLLKNSVNQSWQQPNSSNRRTNIFEEVRILFVHFYLFLLLIVSLPGPHRNRVVWKYQDDHSSTNSSLDSSEMSPPVSESHWTKDGDEDEDVAVHEESQMKKSLSYFL